MSDSAKDITQILLDLAAGEGDSAVVSERLYGAVYEELRVLAQRLMRGERVSHTLQPTALVHEAYLKLVDGARSGWDSRAHFFGTAARAMRQVLVDHARKHRASKRGGELQRVTLDEALAGPGQLDFEILALNEALEKLARHDERMARVIELRIFAGMSAKETAHILGVSKRTVDEDWRMARMWLARELTAGDTR